MVQSENYLNIFYLVSLITAILDSINLSCIDHLVFAFSVIFNLCSKLIMMPCQTSSEILLLSLCYEIIFIGVYSSVELNDSYSCYIWFQLYRQMFTTFNIIVLCCILNKNCVGTRNNEIRIFIEIEPSITERVYQITEIQIPEWECCICLEGENGDNVFNLACGHCFHENCAVTWFQRSLTCPLCRNDV